MIHILAIAFAAALTLADLPPAVRQTVERENRGAPISHIGKQSGAERYEVSFAANGRDHRITVEATGAIVEYRDKVELENLPAPAKATIEKAGAGGEIAGVWRYLRGKSLFYSASVMKDGKKTTVRCEPDGSPTQ
jgi:hypothetical protein